MPTLTLTRCPRTRAALPVGYPAAGPLPAFNGAFKGPSGATMHVRKIARRARALARFTVRAQKPGETLLDYVAYRDRKDQEKLSLSTLNQAF